MTGQTQPQPSTPRPGIYSQNNSIIRTIRSATGHDPEAILNWCRSHNAERPDQIPLDKLLELVEWLALGWAANRIGIPLERL